MDITVLPKDFDCPGSHMPDVALALRLQPAGLILLAGIWRFQIDLDQVGAVSVLKFLSEPVHQQVRLLVELFTLILDLSLGLQPC